MPMTQQLAHPLYYEIAGEGETVVLGHAGFVDSRMWQQQWKVLQEQYRVLRYDMQGFGKSGRATAPIDRRQELRHLLDELEIEQAHFIGCSMSGTLFIDFALEYPDKVLSLVTVNAVPNGFEMQGEPPPHMMEMFDAWRAGDFDTVSELQLRIWLDGIYREPHEVDVTLRQQVKEMNRIPVENETMLIADSQPINPLDPPAISRLAELQCPVLVMDSDLDHPEVGQASKVLVGDIPNATRVTIVGAAHLPNIEKPDTFNRAILSFLNGMN